MISQQLSEISRKKKHSVGCCRVLSLSLSLLLLLSAVCVIDGSVPPIAPAAANGGSGSTLRDGGKAKTMFAAAPPGNGGGSSSGPLRDGGKAKGNNFVIQDAINSATSGGGGVRDGGKAKASLFHGASGSSGAVGNGAKSKSMFTGIGGGAPNGGANGGANGGVGSGKSRDVFDNLGSSSNIRDPTDIPPAGNNEGEGQGQEGVTEEGEGEGDDFRVNIGSVSFRSICLEGTYFGQSVYRPLEVVCPPKGESVVVQLKFDTPNPNHGLSWSVAASYGENKDQSNGLELQVLAEGQFVEQKLTSTELWRCSSALYTTSTDEDSSNNKICTTTVVGHNAVGDASIAVTGTIVLTNVDGSCNSDGNNGELIYLESALDDDQPLGNAHTHTCTQRMQVLPQATAGSNIPPGLAEAQNNEDDTNPKILILQSSYAFKDGTARNPTLDEIQALLCRSEPFFQDIIQEKLSYIDNIHSYGHYLDYSYTEPPNNTTFAVDIYFISKVFIGNEDDGAGVDPAQIVDLFNPQKNGGQPPVSQERIQYYVTDIVRPNIADDVFEGVWGWKMKTSWKRYNKIVAEGLYPTFELPITRTCPEPEEPQEGGAELETPEAQGAVAESMRSAPTKDKLCTVRSDITGRPRKYFQPLLLPCPEVGTQVVASMAHTMNFMPGVDLETFQPDIELVASVAYGEDLDQSDGLRLRVHWDPIASADGPSVDCPVNTNDFDDFLSSQITTGHSVDYQHDAPIPHQVTIQIWNEDAINCNADTTMQLEVSMYEPEGLFEEFIVTPPSSSYTAASCLEPFQLDTRCIDDDELPELPEDGSDTDDGVCIYATGTDFMGRSTVAKVYPELYVDCPTQGEFVAVGLAFVMPYQSNQEITQIQISMALAHGESLDQTDGITIELVEGIERCQWAPGLTGSDNTRCPDWFGGEDAQKHCATFNHYESPGDQVHYTAFIHNPNGACQGKIRIEAAIDDRGINYEEASECKDEMEVVQCDLQSNPQVMPQRGNVGGGFQLIPDNGDGSDGDGTGDEDDGGGVSGGGNPATGGGRNPTLDLGGLLGGGGVGNGGDGSGAAEDDSGAAAGNDTSSGLPGGGNNSPNGAGGGDGSQGPNGNGDGPSGAGAGGSGINGSDGGDSSNGSDGSGNNNDEDGAEGGPNQPGDRPWSEGEEGGADGEGGPGSDGDRFRDGDTFESQNNSSGRRDQFIMLPALLGVLVLGRLAL